MVLRLGTDARAEGSSRDPSPLQAEAARQITFLQTVNQ
jgi:hypothetical protein